MFQPALDSHQVRQMIQQFAIERPFCFVAQIGDVVRNLDIAHGRERGQKIEPLKDEADLGPPHPGAFAVVERGKVRPVDKD
jgi:hypothetical protein